MNDSTPIRTTLVLPSTPQPGKLPNQVTGARLPVSPGSEPIWGPNPLLNAHVAGKTA
jgi:hypothetical protein